MSPSGRMQAAPCASRRISYHHSRNTETDVNQTDKAVIDAMTSPYLDRKR